MDRTHTTERQRPRHYLIRTPRPKEGPVYGESDIEWTQEEKNTVAAESYAIYGKEPSMGRMAAIRQAVQLLKPKRRQYIHKWYHVRPWIGKAWRVLDEETGMNYAQENVEHLPMSEHSEKVFSEQSASVENSPQDTLFEPPPADVPAEQTYEAAVAEAVADESPAATESAAADAAKIKRVFWRDDEKEKVALECARLMVVGDRHEEVGMTDVYSAMRQCQYVLPADRARTHIYPSNEGDKKTADRILQLVPIVRRRIEKEDAERRADIEAKERMEQERIEREAREQREAEERIRADIEAERVRLLAEDQARRDRINAEALQAAVGLAVRKELDEMPYTALVQSLAGKLMKDLFGELLEQAGARIEARIESRLNGILDQLTQPAAPEQSELTASVHELRRPLRITIVGLGNQEYDELRREFFSKVEFKQVKVLADSRQGQTGQAMLEAARGCDAVVAMHHAVGGDVKAAALKLRDMRVPYVAITGRVGDLKRRIRGAVDGDLPFELAAA